MATRRIELGLEGPVLRLTVDEGVIAPLAAALAGGGWYEVQSDEGSHWVNLGEVQYLRVVPGEVSSRVGFSGN